MKRLIALIGGAVALLLSNAPLFLFPFALVALVPLFASAERNFRKDLLYGTLFSFPYFAFHLWWIKNLQAGQGLGPIFYGAILLLFLVKALAFGLWFSIATRLSTPMRVGLSYAIYEWILEHLGDLGFPWASLHYSTLGFLPFAQTASLLGPYFISFLIVAFNYSLYQFLQSKTGRNLAGLWIYSAIIVLLSIFGYTYMEWQDGADRSIRVAVVQPNVLPRFEYDPREWRETIAAFRELADTLSRIDYDVAIFSESAIIGMLNYEQNREMLAEFMEKTGRPIILGSTRMEVLEEGEKRFYNTAFLIDTGLRVLDFYDKVRIVPFGENLPFYEFLPPFIRNLQLGQGDYSRGRFLRPIELDSVRIGILICYESIFPSLSRRLVLNGAQILAVITNDGWFGRSLGPVEHFHFSRMRAIETGRYLVRSAKTGISAVIDDNGRILEMLPQFTRGILVEDIPLIDRLTLYDMVGESWIVLFFLIIVANAVFESYTGGRSSPENSSDDESQ